MIEDIEDWVDYCEGTKTFDTNHFYTMFHDHVPMTTIDMVFKFFPEGAVLKQRFMTVYNSGLVYANPNPPARSVASDEALIKTCRAIVDEQIRLLKLLDEKELVAKIENLEVIMTDDEAEFDRLRMIAPQMMVNDVIGDHLIDCKTSKASKYYSIEEAYYGLKCDYELAWYLSKPFLKTPYNTDLYFELWKNQASYLITDDNILLIRIESD